MTSFSSLFMVNNFNNNETFNLGIFLDGEYPEHCWQRGYQLGNVFLPQPTTLFSSFGHPIMGSPCYKHLTAKHK